MAKNIKKQVRDSGRTERFHAIKRNNYGMDEFYVYDKEHDTDIWTGFDEREVFDKASELNAIEEQKNGNRSCSTLG